MSFYGFQTVMRKAGQTLTAGTEAETMGERFPGWLPHLA